MRGENYSSLIPTIKEQAKDLKQTNQPGMKKNDEHIKMDKTHNPFYQDNSRRFASLGKTPEPPNDNLNIYQMGKNSMAGAI